MSSCVINSFNSPNGSLFVNFTMPSIWVENTHGGPLVLLALLEKTVFVTTILNLKMKGRY